jgi:uncharacterized LabA/DUF88 family protein
MKFYSGERVALFIDGANLYSAARALQFDIDYKKLLELFQAKSNLVRAYYYTVLIEDQEYSPIRPLVDWLDYNGYTLVTKPAKDYTDPSGRRRIRNSVDVELAIDMLDTCDRIDHIVLFSGDGGYRRAIEAVQRRGVRVSVVSTVKSSPPMAADELRRQADSFVELADLKADVERPRSGHRQRQDVQEEPDDEEYDDEYDSDEYDEFDDEETEDAEVVRT